MFFDSHFASMRSSLRTMNPTKHKCPACGREVEFDSNANAASCPHCGKSLPEVVPPATANLLIFFAVLLAPAVLALLGALGKIEGLAVGSPLVGGGIAGIICGIMLARRVGRSTGSRIGLGILFVALFAFVSFTLSFFGCLLGGFQMNMH